MFKISWQNEDAKGSFDRIPADFFENDVKNIKMHHVTIFSDGNSVDSHCLVTCQDDFAILDYEHHDVFKHNKNIKIFTGKVALKFADAARVKIVQIMWSNGDGDFEDIEAIVTREAKSQSVSEGASRFIAHFRRERNPQLRAQKIACSDGKCEACGSKSFEKAEFASIMEIHHNIPLSVGLRESKVEHLALLCPNCHRAIHAAMRLKGDIIPIDEFKQQYCNV